MGQGDNLLFTRVKRFFYPVDVSKLSVTPVSRVFGFDRGTPIDRYYIEKFLGENVDKIKGNILEIADSNYSRKFSKDKTANYHVLTFDEPPTEATLIKGDLTKPESLPANAMECFICTQTLNFVYDVKAAIRGCYQILAPHGYLLLTVGALQQISRYDMERWGDYWRFSQLSIRRMLEESFESSKIRIRTYGNLATVVAGLQGLAVEDIDQTSILDETDEDYPMIIACVAQK